MVKLKTYLLVVSVAFFSMIVINICIGSEFLYSKKNTCKSAWLFENKTQSGNENDVCTKNMNASVDDILCMKRLPYLKDFKNPCWMMGNMTIKCLPYFMLIGMDKSGSTDLFNRISKHPEILGNAGMGYGKETQWWSWRRYGYHLVRTQKKLSFSDYVKFFDKAAEHINQTVNYEGLHHLITGDGTPMDLWDFRGWPEIPQNWNKSEPVVLTPHLIRHILPETKFIIILRDPVQRLYSDYHFIQSFLNFQNTTRESFDKDVQSSLEMLNKCRVSNSMRHCLYDKNLHQKWDYRARIHLGFYSVYLKEWLKVFPRRQFLIFRTKDYSINTYEYMSKVFNYLNVGFMDKQGMEKYGILQKKHLYITKRKQNAKPMSNRTKALLSKLYQPYNDELANILSDRRFKWDDV